MRDCPIREVILTRLLVENRHRYGAGLGYKCRWAATRFVLTYRQAPTGENETSRFLAFVYDLVRNVDKPICSPAVVLASCIRLQVNGSA